MFKWPWQRRAVQTAGSPAPFEPAAGPGNAAETHVRTGIALKSQGRIDEAIAQFRHALASGPDSTDAWNQLGVALYERGDAVAAAQAFSSAARLDPQSAKYQSNLATSLAAIGDVEPAIAAFERAVALDPDQVDALIGLGGILAYREEFAKAMACFLDALKADPGSVIAHVNAGNVCRELGQVEQAGTHYEQAMQLNPDFAEAYVNHAILLKQLGREEEAFAQIERALAINPRLPFAHAVCGELHSGARRFREATASFQTALALSPADAEAHFNLAGALMDLADFDGASSEFAQALALRPDYAEARWAWTVAQLPPICRDAAEVEARRAAFASALTELEHWFTPSRAASGHKAVGSRQPFYLAYQEVDNRPLLATYGALCTRLMAQWQAAQAPKHPPPQPRGGKCRLGIVSAHLHDHSVWKAIAKGWVQHLDRERFELILFYLGTKTDEETVCAKAQADRFEHQPRSLKSWVETILASAVDVLLFPEIGMNGMTLKLASLRLAPVQVATWGHPETTGLSTIDYYLSAEDLEPHDGQRYYTEQLVKLPHLSVCYEPDGLPPVVPDRRALGLREGEPLLLCPGSPYKYSPGQDEVWLQIIKRLGCGQLVFFRSRPEELSLQLLARLSQRFAEAGVDFSRHAVLIPPLPPGEFYGLMRAADVFLDTIGFSGFNTAIQAIEQGLPVVTRDGRFMRGRLASGLLKRMGLTELIAATDEDYVALAVEAARNAPHRLRLREEIAARRPVLFGDLAPVRSLEAWLLEVAAQHHRA